LSNGFHGLKALHDNFKSAYDNKLLLIITVKRVNFAQSVIIKWN